MDLNWTVSEKSLSLLEPNLHDGHLLGITLPLPGRAELAVVDVERRAYCIALDGVLRLCAKDFMQGNIILDVTVGRGEQVTPADLAQLEESGCDTKWVYGKIVGESLFVLQLAPSYGCSLTAVAKTIRIYPAG